MASHIYFFIFLSYKTRFLYKSREKHLKFSVKVQLRILKQLTIVQKFRFKWLRHVYKYAVSNEMISQYYKYPVCCTPLLFFGCVALTSLATIFPKTNTSKHHHTAACYRAQYLVC